MAAPSSPDFRPQTAAAGSASANALLADRANRAILATLGDARSNPLDATGIADAFTFDVTPRLVRDRLRVLERRGVVFATSRASSDGSEPTRWALSAPGRDLHRLLSLITRIAGHAARLPDSAPARTVEPVIGCALASLADPVVVEVGRQLAAVDFLEPLELEPACPTVPRRTLYRRLSPLVDAGVILRHTTRQVPRSTRYAFSDHWRPAVAILVLTAWWEGRHRAEGAPGTALDLEGVVRVIAPTVSTRRIADGTAVRWCVEELDHEGHARPFDVRVTPAGLQVGPPAGDADATVRGPVDAWTGGLVEGHHDALALGGDTDRAGALLAAVRSALLAYVR